MTDALGRTLGTTATPDDRAGGPRAEPHLYMVMEAKRPLGSATRHSLAGLHAIQVGRGGPRSAVRRDGELTLTIPDRWMSSRHARITSSFGRWLLEDCGSKNGSVANGRPVRRHELRDGDLLELGHSFFMFRAAVDPVEGDAPDLDAATTTPAAPGMLTLSADFAKDLAKISQLAPTPVSLLILGESGTGKEVLAQAVHRLSGRPGEFIGVNCGAIPDTLIESELFGHKKGAFSGAVADQPGLVRSADRGTLFLDEIGDLPPASQAAFLRVLQEREVRPVGSTRSVPVEIRLVSATHRDLDHQVTGGSFRRDLFARVAGYRITLPSLRNRREDLGLLVAALLPRVTPNPDQVAFEVDAARALFQYHWPLNIRELENCLTTAVVLANGEPIRLEHLSEELRAGPATGGSAAAPSPQPTPDLSSDQRAHRAEVIALLQEHQGNVSAVARATGKDRKQVQRWIKRYRLDPDSYRS